MHNAARALASVNESGYYLNDWNGKPLADGLGEEASNLELFAWLAAYRVLLDLSRRRNVLVHPEQVRRVIAVLPSPEPLDLLRAEALLQRVVADLGGEVQ